MIIDAHIHFGDTHPDLRALLDELDIKLLNICVNYADMGDWRMQAEKYCSLAKAYPNRFAWCTSFDLPHFDDPDYISNVKQMLDQDFADGAVACKIWKNIGMEVRKPSGEFMMPDNPMLDPIYDHVRQAGKTLLMHVAEPVSCWQPLPENSPPDSYYRRNPQWHMYNKPDHPSHAQLMAARDHMVEKHPDLRFVGAHIGSLDHDVDLAAQTLARYPNLAMDVSARLGGLIGQDSTKVRQFFLDFSDQILFGTDVVMRKDLSQMSATDRAETLDSLRSRFRTYFDYFATDQIVEYRGQKARGLALPDDVLEKFYLTNAQTWYPGL